MSLNIGTKLGTFEIIGLLGKGGMGEVYRATDSKLGREVAIKVLSENVAQDEERLERFKREAMTLASLDHSNIGALYDFQTENGYHFLVMQLIEGDTLADRIAQGPIMTSEVVPVFTQIAETLEEAHNVGIVHRDLKPANIKITDDDKVRVIDFGIAKTLTQQSSFGMTTPTPGSTPDPEAPTRIGIPTPAYSLTHEGMMVGTPSYRSPEQVRGRAVDRRTDIWAFGICMYEALTGTMPFQGDTISDVLSSVLRDDVDWDKLPDNLPRNIRRLLKRCLEHDLRLRLRDIGEAWVALRADEDDEPVVQVITQENPHVSRFTISLPDGARLSTSPAPCDSRLTPKPC
ncbi:MAG: serine/threonine-protein kinase [Candidatus Hydrogenedentota bacterium]